MLDLSSSPPVIEHSLMANTQYNHVTVILLADPIHALLVNDTPNTPLS